MVMLCQERISEVGNRSFNVSHAVNLTLRGVGADQIRDAGMFVGDVGLMW